MTCKECTELLIDFVAGELSAEHTIILREHLQLCPPCEQYLVTYETTIKLTRKLPMAAMPATLMQRLQEALREMQDSDQ